MSTIQPRLDPDRNRRRMQVLAEIAGAKRVRDRERPGRARIERLQELIAARRRLAAG